MADDPIIELARQQGVRPVEDIRMLAADFWPPGTDVDEFLARDEAEDRVGCVLGLVVVAAAFACGVIAGWWLASGRSIT